MQHFLRSIDPVWFDTHVLPLLFLIVFIALIGLWRNRRSVARGIDSAAVTTLATGLKASRKIAAGGRRYRDRIRDKAGH